MGITAKPIHYQGHQVDISSYWKGMKRGSTPTMGNGPISSGKENGNQ